MPITTTNDATNYNDSLLRNTNYAPPPNHDRTTPQHPHPSTGDKHTRLGSSTSMVRFLHFIHLIEHARTESCAIIYSCFLQSNISTFSSNARTNETCAMDWQEGDNMNDNFQVLFKNIYRITVEPTYTNCIPTICRCSTTFQLEKTYPEREAMIIVLMI